MGQTDICPHCKKETRYCGYYCPRKNNDDCLDDDFEDEDEPDDD